MKLGLQESHAALNAMTLWLVTGRQWLQESQPWLQESFGFEKSHGYKIKCPGHNNEACFQESHGHR
jgi:hypothetical protein